MDEGKGVKTQEMNTLEEKQSQKVKSKKGGGILKNKIKWE